MAYSKISSVEVTNFMVYAHATISFDDSNIINLKGYNSSGKSTMLKAIGVCLMNLFPQGQAKLIKHGEDYFRVVVNFDDGVSIVRDKYSNGQSLYEMYKNGDLLYTSKIGRKLGKISEVPELIQNYLGLCVMTDGCLNYQSRQDRLWLIETKGSENYYSLNEILRTEEIARANQMLNSDKNKLGNEIAGIEATLNEVTASLEEIQGVDDRLLLALEEREDKSRTLVNRYKGLSALNGITDELERLRLYPVVETISTDQYSEVEDLSKSVKTLSSLKVYPEISSLGVSRLDSISWIQSMSKELESISKNVVPTVSSIEVGQVSPISGMLDVLKELDTVMKEKSSIESDLKKANAKMEKAIEVARKEGKKFVACENCGTYMEVSVE